MSRFRLTVLTLFRLGLQRGGPRSVARNLAWAPCPASKCQVCWSAYEVTQYFEMK